MSTTVCVLEVGGTHVTAATVDVGAQVVCDRSRHALDGSGSAAAILAQLRGAAMTLAAPERARWAIAIPDPFDYDRGIGLFRDVGKFDALYGVDVGAALAASISPRPRSITFTHDTEAFLMGEWLRGAARGVQRCAAVTLGTGVGSAFLVDGTTVRAGPGLPPDGRIHRATVDGAPLEARVSRRAIRAGYATATGTDLDVAEIADRARRGEPAAGEVLEQAFHALGRAIAPAMRGFAPDVLVIGGAIAGSWDLLIGPLCAGLRAGGVPHLEIRPAWCEADSSVLGAAWQASVAASRAPRAPDPGVRDAVLHLLARRDLAARLADYYAPDGPWCGTNFLDGTEACSPDTVTAADLFAVTTLGLEVPAPVTRRLLHDTAASAAVSAALAMLPVEVSLDDATAETLHDMSTLHDALLSATGGAGELTTALCARKRPELFPVLDGVCCAGLRLPPGSVAASWRALRAVLRDPEVRAGLARAFDAVRRRGLRVDVFPLRQLAVLAAIARDRY